MDEGLDSPESCKTKSMVRRSMDRTCRAARPWRTATRIRVAIHAAQAKTLNPKP